MATRKNSPQPAPNQNQQSKETTVVSANWSGPLPPPGALQQFNEILDNGAERIMTMVEEEQKHRIKINKWAAVADIVDVLGGKLLGALMTIACVGASIYTAKIGAHWSVSVAIVGVPIMALIGKFIRPR